MPTVYIRNYFVIFDPGFPLNFAFLFPYNNSVELSSVMVCCGFNVNSITCEYVASPINSGVECMEPGVPQNESVAS